MLVWALVGVNASAKGGDNRDALWYSGLRRRPNVNLVTRGVLGLYFDEGTSPIHFNTADLPNYKLAIRVLVGG